MNQTTASYATLCAAFQEFAKKSPDAVIIRSVGGSTEITWREWDRRVRKLAAGLAALLVPPAIGLVGWRGASVADACLAAGVLLATLGWTPLAAQEDAATCRSRVRIRSSTAVLWMRRASLVAVAEVRRPCAAAVSVSTRAISTPW